MPKTALEQGELFPLMRAIIRGDAGEVAKRLEAYPLLATAHLVDGATREEASNFYFEEISHYLYTGDTPLHAAAAGYRVQIARLLITMGADVAAKNRRGAEPLHYASDSHPGSPNWNPQAQAEMITLLVEARANPNTLDKSGVAPLHRAVRQRGSAAVELLLRLGANVRLKNGSGSMPLHLAVQNTGRSGSGSPEAKAGQREIIELLLRAKADPQDRDGRGKTVIECATSEWVRDLLSRN